jgi:murein L,D-transpeptidase YcbB/YkuD
MTAISDINFNPYWNAPPSIIERDIIPKIVGGNSSFLQKMNMKVFDGVGGPEIDPNSVNWRRAVADNYQFRQEPGGENAMATAKINFSSPFGNYLHDTPEQHLFEGNGRFFSSGCVRVQKVAILLNWILNGQDGFNPGRIEDLAQSLERLDVKIANPPQLRVAYLTAWPTAGG